MREMSLAKQSDANWRNAAHNMLPKALRVFGKIWLYGAIALILLGYGATWFLHGFGALLALVSPYNYSNFIAVAITLAPAYFLQKMADEIETKQYRKVLLSGGAVFLSVAAVAVILMLARNSQSKHDASDSRTREYQATSIRVKGKSATMYQHKNYFVTVVSGPVGSEGIPEMIQLGDVVTVKDSSIQVQHIFVTEFLADMRYGKEILGKKGDVHCTIVQSRENLPSVDEHESRDRLWVNVTDCEPLNVFMSEKPSATDLKTALARYQAVVGVLPKEFLTLSSVEQEAYVRGVLDGQYFLLGTSNHPDRDLFVNCLNAQLKTIASEARRFVDREGEQKLLMPWTLSRLVGQACPKESRAKKPSDYTEASTSTELVFLGSDEKQQDAIDNAFVRGVLDGKVFVLYGHDYPKLVRYLECLSRPNSLREILIAMRAADALGKNSKQSQAYNVAEGEALVCKELSQ